MNNVAAMIGLPHDIGWDRDFKFGIAGKTTSNGGIKWSVVHDSSVYPPPPT